MIILSTQRYTRKTTSSFAAVIAGLVLLFSCTGKGKPFATGSTPERAAALSAKPCFTPPDIPSVITDVNKRRMYPALHRWECFDFADTACIHNPDVSEQAFVDLLDILPLMDKAETTEVIHNLLSQARREETGRVYAYFLKLAEKYLYDANSPLRDEELFVPFAEYVLNNNGSNERERVCTAFRLEEINKNRRSTVATDFTYTLPDRQTGRLHGIRAEYTLLYFYNPACENCQRTKEALECSALVSSLTEAGKMKILMLYPNGNPEEWEACRKMPMHNGWINARDSSKELAIKERLYALRAIPSLYLLDRDKRVILKDADYPRLKAWLGRAYGST